MRKLTRAQTRKAIATMGIERPLLEAFALANTARHVRYEFHTHTKHQLLAPGPHSMLTVETDDRLHIFASPLAVWIPAGTRHATTVGAEAPLSLFFPANRYASPVKGLCQLRVSTLTRELLQKTAGEWPAPKAVRRGMFDLLHYLCVEALKTPASPALPRPRSPVLGQAVSYLLAHLDTITPASLAREMGMSERTLRRRFQEELQLPPERYLQQARMTQAMHLLMNRGADHSITDIALEVGYQNHSAFSAAFRRFTGRRPIDYRPERR